MAKEQTAEKVSLLIKVGTLTNATSCYLAAWGNQ